ncbi:hypothetical protein SEUCBS139899_006444, partial [Sporothrix eucalyptigena]
RLAEVMGAESTVPRSCDTRLPSNIGDTDLEPGVTTLPDSKGTSDMVFCPLKYETVRFLQERDPRTSTVPEPDSATDDRAHPPKMRSVGALERLLEERFLRFCDPLVPLHVFTTTIARSSVCKFRHMEQRGQASTCAREIDTRETNRRILQMAARNVAYDNLLHTTPSLAGFLWYAHFHFPWGAPIFILRILGTARTPASWDDDMHAAWAHILELHRHHPEFAVRDADRVEHLLVVNLTLEAWRTREEVLARTEPVPGVILALQGSKEASSGVKETVDTVADTTTDVTHAPACPAMAMQAMPMDGFAGNFALISVNTVNSALAGIDWEDWGSY